MAHARGTVDELDVATCSADKLHAEEFDVATCSADKLHAEELDATSTPWNHPDTARGGVESIE